MAAGDRDVNAGKFFLHGVRHSQQIGHERLAFARVRRSEFRLGQDQHVPSVAARDAAIDNLRLAEAALQWHDFAHYERAAADGVGGNNVLEHHPFRPGEFAAHYREELAHFDGVELPLQQLRIGFCEKIR